MSIDWQKEVDSRKDDLLKDLKELLAINSVRDDERATDEAPVGPGPKDALLKFLEYGDRDGFTTKNVDNLAGHIEYGEGDETLGIFGHVDVVPVGDGWESDPFTPEVRDGRLYARGASDDKGPSMAAYYGLKIIKDLKLPVSKRVRFIIGTDEESGWMCMNHYLEVEEKPDFGFSPDAEFPIINGEKGNVTFNVVLDGENDGDYQLISFESGIRPNMVPEKATAVVKTKTSDLAENLNIKFNEYLANNKVTGTSDVAGDTVTIHMIGKAAHAQEPKDGVNAATYLANFLNSFEFKADAASFLMALGEHFHDDSRAVKLGISYSDPKMGDLTMNPGVITFKANEKENVITLNFRYPQGMMPEQIQTAIAEILAISLEQVQQAGHAQIPHYVPADDPLVTTLLDVYEEHTGQKGSERVIGGGTFGRLLPRGVAYGAMFPHSVDTMHQSNEFIALDDLFNAAVIYADAIYRLIK